MGKTVSVDVRHQLGAVEAECRVRIGVDALQQKFADHLSALRIDWTPGRADASLTVLGHTIASTIEFLPEVVRISVDLPLLLALAAEKIKGSIAQHTGEMLQLPPPKA